jgi:hypothetical protein
MAENNLGVADFGGFAQGDFMMDDEGIPEELLLDED